MELDNNLDEIIDRHRKEAFSNGLLCGAAFALGVFIFTVLVIR